MAKITPIRGGTKASGKHLESIERQTLALNLRKSGMGFAEIADHVGYASASGAHKAVMSALRKTIQEPADELRKLEVERLDAILSSLWPHVMKGSARHAEVTLKVMDRRAAMLGLDAPKQVEDHHSITISIMAEQLAAETGLNKAEIMAEAEAIVARAAEATQ